MTPQRDAYAVIVGIGQYRDAQVRRLNYARDDAKALRDVLVDPEYGAFPEENVRLLLDGEASLRAIKGAIGSWLFKSAGPQATAIVFFAGHGGLEPDKEGRERDGLAKYLLPWDAEPEDLFSTGLSDSEFRRLLNAIQAQSVVVFLDACYAAGVTPRGGRNVGVVENPFARLSQGRGRLVIASAQPNQQSWEDDSLRHGIFTHHLLEALRGEGDRDADGCVSAYEVFAHLQRRVPESARRLSNSVQQPMLCGEESRSIILTMTPGRRQGPGGSTGSSGSGGTSRDGGTAASTRRFCIACGAPIAVQQQFCTGCGKRLV